MIVGTQIGPFHVEREIGSGAMGTVYKARFVRGGDDRKVVPVALKMVSIGLLGNEGALARFEREANILKQLKHPHIVRLIATGRYKKTPFIAMEFVDGQSLDRVLNMKGRIGWEDAVTWAKQLCEALHHAHERGIIHRDLKPSNLMITRENILKLTDFGIAKDTDMTALTGANSTIGTAAYMSPEQCKGDRTLGPKSDLYSLGVVLYELITGQKPFVSDSTIDMFLKHVNEIPVRPRKLIPDLPVWIDNMIMFLLEKDKNQRPLDASVVAKMLSEAEEKIAAQQSVGAELANSRKVDRPLIGGSLSEKDKETAGLMGGKAKRRGKKKRSAWYRKPWVGITGALAVLLLMVGFVYWATLPPSLEKLYEVARSAEPGRRSDAAQAFLTRYGETEDPKVEEIRAIYRQEKAQETFAVLLRRYHSRMKNNYEGFDETTYRAAISALDLEATGELSRAAELWDAARSAMPKGEPELTDRAAVQKAALGWIADEQLQLIRKQIGAIESELVNDIQTARRNEVAREYDNPAKGIAAMAMRYYQFGDFSRARTMWEQLRTDTEKDPDNRDWYLLSTKELNRLSDKEYAMENAGAQRIKLITAAMNQADVDAKRLADNTEARTERRQARNTCQEIMSLYGDETEQAIKELVSRAKLALTLIPKSAE